MTNSSQQKKDFLKANMSMNDAVAIIQALAVRTGSWLDLDVLAQLEPFDRVLKIFQFLKSIQSTDPEGFELMVSLGLIDFLKSEAKIRQQQIRSISG